MMIGSKKKFLSLQKAVEHQQFIQHLFSSHFTVLELNEQSA